MSKHSLSFHFKGSRQYVQGPDIFDHVIELIQVQFPGKIIRDIRYAGHKMLRTNADVFIGKELENDYNSSLTFKIADVIYFASVVSNNIPIESSVEFNELFITDKCVIDRDDIELSLADPEAFSFTETIVSMNKFYLQKCVTDKGKWIVTKFDYNTLVQNFANTSIKLTLMRNLSNRLTKSAIYKDGILVGNLFFSLT